MDRQQTKFDLQIFYFDLLKEKYQQIKTMLEKQKDIYTCYKVLNATNKTSIEKCQDFIQQDMLNIDLHIQMLQDLISQRTQESQEHKKEINQQIISPLG